MKKYYYFLFVVGILLIGSTKISVAEEQCGTAVIRCDNGNEGMGLVCGETYDELAEDVDDLADVICNP